MCWKLLVFNEGKSGVDEEKAQELFHVKRQALLQRKAKNL
jgi:hypothetical protein